MPGRPLVSVCVPTRNGMPFLEECLDGILAQTFRNFELLVVDDASTDGTWERVGRRLGAEPRARLHRNGRNLGLVGNWNRCVSLARGEWVKFAFQDDVLRPACLERMLAAGRGASLVACRRATRFEPGVSPEVRGIYRRHWAAHGLARRFPGQSAIGARAFARLMLEFPGFNCVGEPSAVLVRRRAFERFGPFNPALVSLCDWELWARVAVNLGLRFVDETLAVFRVHPGSQSHANRARRRFHAEVLDELVIRHDLLFSPAYAPARLEARRLGPAADLEGGLAAAADRARRLAAGGLNGAAGAWRSLLARYPRLAAFAARGGALAERRAGRAAEDESRRRAVAAELWRLEGVRG